MTRRRFISNTSTDMFQGLLCHWTISIAIPKPSSDKPYLSCNVSLLKLFAYQCFGVVTFEVRGSYIVSPYSAYPYSFQVYIYYAFSLTPPLFHLLWVSPSQWMGTICHNVGAECFPASMFARDLPVTAPSPPFLGINAHQILASATNR